MPKNVMCKNCNNYRNDWCEMVLDSPDPDIVRDCRHFWLKTNADRIRAMTDEELARFLLHEISTDQYGTMFIDKTLLFNENDMVEWLQQPAEGDA